jgi:ribosomal protein L11 methyltransferase
VEWRKGFTSFPVGRRFRVVPGWETPPEGDTRLAIRIEPGMAFGTGTHETTQLVIEALEERAERAPGARVLDLGTGSGILAIAASKLGQEHVSACDIDADAVSVARLNFRKNDAAVAVFVGTLDGVASGALDLLLGNLTGPVIGDLAGEIRRVLGSGGTGLFSGILTEEAGAVESRLAARELTTVRRGTRGEWAFLEVRSGGD